jgi:hypothetical protein
MHGHLRETNTLINGALSGPEVEQGLKTAIDRFSAQRSASLQLYHGPFSLALGIGADGKPREQRVLLDRVFGRKDGDMGWQTLRDELLAAVASARFPAAEGETRVILPLMLGDPLPVR